jgi:hypothetical protein
MIKLEKLPSALALTVAVSGVQLPSASATPSSQLLFLEV